VKQSRQKNYSNGRGELRPERRKKIRLSASGELKEKKELEDLQEKRACIDTRGKKMRGRGGEKKKE